MQVARLNTGKNWGATHPSASSRAIYLSLPCHRVLTPGNPQVEIAESILRPRLAAVNRAPHRPTSTVFRPVWCCTPAPVLCAKSAQVRQPSAGPRPPEEPSRFSAPPCVRRITFNVHIHGVGLRGIETSRRSQYLFPALWAYSHNVTMPSRYRRIRLYSGLRFQVPLPGPYDAPSRADPCAIATPRPVPPVRPGVIVWPSRAR